jgi:DNA-binding CsgD family transcriptional regulator
VLLDELATRAVRRARDSGMLEQLPIALVYRAGVHVYAGEFSAAADLVQEANSIAAATGNAALGYASVLLDAWRSDEATALDRFAWALSDADRRGEGRAIGQSRYFSAILHNGLGRYDEALTDARTACGHDDLGVRGFALVELIEAAARGGSPDVAAEALRELELRAVAAGTDWALGILARSAALLATGADADALYLEALERLARTRVVVHLARARLIYGEWLRRENRRRDAREQLRSAYDMFQVMGAGAFAERARRELVATGETARPRMDPASTDLTPQEVQIVRLAVEGQSNPEIGSQLFISPRTVEYHLSKVYTKLGIGSRRELRRSLPRLQQLHPPALR